MTFKCSRVEIDSTTFTRGSNLSVEIDLSLEDLIDQLDGNEILDAIGKDACIEHFGIEEVE